MPRSVKGAAVAAALTATLMALGACGYDTKRWTWEAAEPHYGDFWGERPDWWVANRHFEDPGYAGEQWYTDGYRNPCFRSPSYNRGCGR